MSRSLPFAVLLAAILVPSSFAAAIDPASPQWARALKGIVVGPDGKPVTGAMVKCLNVRTPGEGLISSVGQPEKTDAQGRFAIYPMDAEQVPFNGPIVDGDIVPGRPRERGDLVPLNSK